MQSLFKKLIPSKLKPVACSSDTDLKGFDLADSLEGGVADAGSSDWLKPMNEPGVFLIRKRAALNEWVIADYKSTSFVMRAAVEVEQEGLFRPDFDTVAVQKKSGRVRVAVYFSEVPGSLPAVLMVSSPDRVDWKVYTSHCEACRYRRRRSSFTEGSSGDDSPVDSVRSACSYTHSGFSLFAGYDVPSGQEILRMRHTLIALQHCAFTKINASIPVPGSSWCPAVRENVAQDVHHVTTVSPTYSEKLKALALEFRQRTVLASRRNFQIQDSIGQHYRSGKNEYTLEIAAPMSLVQAFCIALSTLLWQ